MSDEQNSDKNPSRPLGGPPPPVYDDRLSHEPHCKFCDYVVRAAAYHSLHPEQRTGQAYWNALADFDFPKADELWGGELDCFHNDASIAALIGHLMAEWEHLEVAPEK